MLYQDAVPINKEFKFEEKRKNISIIKEKIINIFNNFETEIVFFEDYREKLQEEKKIFQKQVDNIFK